MNCSDLTLSSLQATHVIPLQVCVWAVPYAHPCYSPAGLCVSCSLCPPMLFPCRFVCELFPMLTHVIPLQVCVWAVPYAYPCYSPAGLCVSCSLCSPMLFPCRFVCELFPMLTPMLADLTSNLENMVWTKSLTWSDGKLVCTCQTCVGIGWNPGLMENWYVFVRHLLAYDEILVWRKTGMYWSVYLSNMCWDMMKS